MGHTDANDEITATFEFFLFYVFHISFSVSHAIRSDSIEKVFSSNQETREREKREMKKIACSIVR